MTPSKATPKTTSFCRGQFWNGFARLGWAVQTLIVLVILLPLAHAWRRDFVNGSGSGEERTIGFAETPVSARFFVDLDFKSGMHCDKCGVVRRVNRVWRRIGQTRVT